MYVWETDFHMTIPPVKPDHLNGSDYKQALFTSAIEHDRKDAADGKQYRKLEINDESSVIDVLNERLKVKKAIFEPSTALEMQPDMSK